MDDVKTWQAIDMALAVAAAVIVAYGVLVLGWSPFIVVMLYWFENVVIGVFNVAKILLAGVRVGPAGVAGAVAASAFFTVHYGLFTLGHGVLLAQLFGSAELGRSAMDGGLFGALGAVLHHLLTERESWLAMIAIIAAPVGLFLQWSVSTRELPPPLNELMSAPYGRIIVLHITLIGGAFLMQALQAPKVGALLLVVLKLAYDLFSLKRDRRLQEETEAQVRVRRLLVFGRRKLDGRP
jgi:hypothetical protein